MDIKQTYNEWLENAVEDKDLKAELESIKNNEDEIYDRFYTALNSVPQALEALSVQVPTG